MIQQPTIRPSTPASGFMFFLSVIVLIIVVFGCSIYANLSFAITDKEYLEYLPPFKPRINANWNHHLGAEYFHIAQALAAGKGFSDPFTNLESGPTAWMPPILPAILVSLLWMFDGDKDLVMVVVVFLQVLVVIGTGVLVLALARQTTSRLWTVMVLMLFLLGVVYDFRSWFQFTHDCWLVLLALDLLMAGLCWLRPLDRWTTAASWGLFGGLCALINPLVGFTWGFFSCMIGVHQRRWSRLAVTLLAAALALMPWTVRNYLVFGRFIPVKPNLAYELYQSQCLQPDGLIQLSTFQRHHPNSQGTRERQEYKTLGETAYLDRKSEQFWEAVEKDPQDFIERAADRFLGATLWYQPLERTEITKRPWVMKLTRWSHPLPFLAFLVLIFMAVYQRLHWAEWTAMGVYVLYLFPYIGISYYDRYAVPLLAVKVLLVVWAMDRLLSLLPRIGRTTSVPQMAAVPLAGASKLGRAVPVSS
jgi:hypothetical protein